MHQLDPAIIATVSNVSADLPVTEQKRRGLFSWRGLTVYVRDSSPDLARSWLDLANGEGQVLLVAEGGNIVDPHGNLQGRSRLHRAAAQRSNVALLAYSTFVSTAASIAQQLHTIVRWDEVKTEQYYYILDHIGSPELIIAGPSYGLDLALYYIQYYCYNVEGILTVMWAFVLAFSIFKPSEQNWHQRISRQSNIIAKTVAFVLPAVFIGLLHIEAVRSSIAVFITLANFELAASLTVGSILLLAILAKYIQTRRKLHRWTVRYPLPGSLSANEGDDEQDLSTEDSIYDSWLIVRFVISLLFIEAFQILTILSEVAQINNNKREALPSEPDLSAAHARIDFLEFIPGVSAGLLVPLGDPAGRTPYFNTISEARPSDEIPDIVVSRAEF
ncbi:hypothetical protein O1611_g5019 [Lasiodiplodia mahajangana]|uniref:Uncharacterized protein n=1 Tax=Lasiodiplodia mahajangana TaxID=1108764 RepID=A0ACC2JM72_9PEZI|nr:hypothetical protein O1611_g5019 [Lasiodiplodia mahajangana]